MVEGHDDIRDLLGDGAGNDALTKAVTRARVASKLFRSFEPVTFGRYQLLERVGAGGLGVVWGGWDPQLERRVAIKVMQPTVAIAKERVLAEGQALAKLSDPNVVPIFDVGVIGDEIYLVMEWVRGQTLREYATPDRSVAELVGIYRQAASGLAAAHREGLVHCDFKPDNAIVGSDGRVRVLDFGLAALAGGSDLRGGTQRYRAPELAIGSDPSFTSDQYAFAVSLGEALAVRGEVPRWLATIVARGTAVDPTRRFASLDDLDNELSRDPDRARRRRLVFTGAATCMVAVTALVSSRLASPAATESCSGSADAIESVWNHDVRAKLVEHVGQLGPLGASIADSLTSELDAQASALRTSHHSSCLTHKRGEITDDLYARRLDCLGGLRAALGTSINLLVTAQRTDLDNAVQAERSHGDPAVCSNDDVVSAGAPPPTVASQVSMVMERIASARVLVIAAHPSSMTAAEAAVAEARATGYEPAIVKALITSARALLATGSDARRASTILHEAVDTALRHGDTSQAIEAYARLVFAIALQDSGGLDGMEIVGALAEHVASREPFGRALLDNNLGVFHMNREDRTAARNDFSRALAEARAAGGDRDVELVNIPLNLAMVSPIDDSEAIVTRGVEALANLLGENHANSINAMILSGLLAADPQRARARIVDACSRLERWHPELPADSAACQFELGLIDANAGDVPGASVAMSRARLDPLAGRNIATLATSYIGVMTGPTLEKVAAMARLETIASTSGTGPRWDRIDASEALILLALGWQQLGLSSEAKTSWRRAQTVLSGLDTPIVRNLVTWTQRELAR